MEAEDSSHATAECRGRAKMDQDSGSRSPHEPPERAGRFNPALFHIIRGSNLSGAGQLRNAPPVEIVLYRELSYNEIKGVFNVVPDHLIL